MKSTSTVMIPQPSAALTTIMMTTTILGIDSFLVIIIHRTIGALRTIRGTGAGAAIICMTHTIQRFTLTTEAIMVTSPVFTLVILFGIIPLGSEAVTV